MSLADEPASWPVVESRDLHRDDWVLALRADRITRPDDRGEPDQAFRRLVVELPGAVMILAVDEQEQVVVLRQYRHPVGATLVELPAGLLDVAGEDPVDAARRELREEAGLEAEVWEHLVSVYPSPGISTEIHLIYLATGLHDVGRGDFVPEHEEAEMSLDRVPVAELLEAVRTGEVRDAPLVTALLAYDHRERRRVGSGS